MESQNLESLVWLIAGGFSLAASGIGYLLFSERKHFRSLNETDRSWLPVPPAGPLWPWLLVAILMAIHFSIGFQSIELRGLSSGELLAVAFPQGLGD